MNLEKITRIGCIALGVLGMIFLSLVFFTGDDSIKMAAASGDYGVITPIILLSQIVLFIAVLVTLTFSLRGIAKDKAKMKNAIKSAGLFLLVVLIGFLLSNGVETPMRDGKVLSAIHVTPEAIDGGTISKIQDGDKIEIDANIGKLNLNEDFSNRKNCQLRKASNVGFGRNLFSLLRKNAISAESGAGLNLIND